MSELSFLLELLLNHKLPKATKEVVVGRIKEIEASPVNRPNPWLAVAAQAQKPPKTAQSQSTQRILDEMANEGMVMPIEPQHFTAKDQLNVMVGSGEQASIPTQIAQTPAAAAALAQRNEAIRIAVSGREEKGRTSPRKF